MVHTHKVHNVWTRENGQQMRRRCLSVALLDKHQNDVNNGTANHGSRRHQSVYVCVCMFVTNNPPKITHNNHIDAQHYKSQPEKLFAEKCVITMNEACVRFGMHQLCGNICIMERGTLFVTFLFNHSLITWYIQHCNLCK